MDNNDNDDIQLIEYRDRRRRFRLAFCRAYYFLQEILIKVPRYSRSFYRQKVANLPDEPQFKIEKQIWLTKTSLSNITHTSFPLIVYCFYLCLKYSIFNIYTMANVDFKQPEVNVFKVEDKMEYQFACMATNCTRLSKDNELAQDLIQLPVFSICKPQLARLYTPLIDVHQIGLMILTLITFFLFSGAVLVPLVGVNLRVPLRLSMFIICPNITRRLEAKRIRGFCLRFARSYDNYRRVLLQHARYNHRKYVPFQAGLETPTTRLTRPSMNHLQCLPINSTGWWHEQLVLFSPIVSMMCNLGILTFTLIVAVYARNSSLQLFGNHYVDYSNYIKQTQATCSIWTQGNKTVDLTQIASNFDCFRGADFAFFLVIMNILFSFCASGAYQIINDIQVCINDLRLQLEMAIHLASLRSSAGHFEVNPNGGSKVTAGKGSMFQEIRDKVIENSSYSRGVIITKRLAKTKLGHNLACQEFAWQLLNQFGFSTEVYANQLEKIQISYWNLDHLIGEFNEPFSCLLGFSWLFNFGFSIISVYLTRKVLTYRQLPLLFNISAMVTLNLYIAMISIVHSAAKTLEPLVWSLISLNLHERSSQIGHWACLASKHLESIDARGGLGVRTFGVRITYVHILEVSFWATTIILFAHTRY